jgi:hypothetical protein
MGGLAKIKSLAGAGSPGVRLDIVCACVMPCKPKENRATLLVTDEFVE